MFDVKTEPNMQLSLFLLQIVKVEKDNRIRTTVYSVLFCSCSIYFEHFVIGLICLSTYMLLSSAAAAAQCAMAATE